ncbi:MAG: PD-(D/E)XK nuclease family protein [Burkholderiales bacterium]|nr:PD-(D/E)XK nuclease family protein [Burkholderiales bacterium]
MSTGSLPSSATPTDFDAAAAEFLAHEAERLPDLSRCTVLLPHMGAAAPLLAALRARIANPVFLPPRLTTFRGLAAAVPVAAPVEAQGVRLAQVHDVLAHAAVGHAQARWALAMELLELIDELSAEGLEPSAERTQWLAQVSAAYGRRSNALLEAEAVLVLELWRAMHQGRCMDPMHAYAHRLAQAARAAAGPLYTLGLLGLTRLERGLLEQWAQRQPVRTLPWQPRLPERHALCAALWPARPDAPLAERMRQLAAHQPASPLLPQVRLAAAVDLESEAAAAAAQVQAWAAAGLSRIALIALDRLTARRLRALLERSHILVQDETGWTLPTAAASHVPDRLCALRQDGAYHRDLVDLLKSPFVFADLDRAARLQAVAALETAIRQAVVLAGLPRFLELARTEAPHTLPLLERLDQALGRLAGGPYTLGEWQQRLLAALQIIGADVALAADAAGRTLLERLQALTAEVAGHDGRYDFAAWRGWLELQLQRATFREDDIDSPVRLLSLEGARLREFDAAILLGADAAHLPAACDGAVFNDRVRAQLGLPTAAGRELGQRQAFIDVLCHIPHLLITWQARREGEPNAASPWLQLLEAAHRLAWAGSLVAVPPSTECVPSVVMPPQPAPPAPARLPERLSASAWQSLVDCPYRFHARHILSLSEFEPVPEEVAKRDYGQLVHAILHAFHRAHPRLADTPRERLRETLTRLTREAFAPLTARAYLAVAWQLRWERRLEAYLDWALAHEERGHRWQTGEVEYSRLLDLPDGRAITLQGRIDRIDHGPSGPIVLDYKARRRSDLRQRLRRPGEDVQLAFYGLLTQAQQAAYVALDDETIDLVAPAGELPALCAREAARLSATLARILAGAPLPAHGAAEVCRYCEMRGLCRRDWREEAAQPHTDGRVDPQPAGVENTPPTRGEPPCQTKTRPN